jgi:hypothetical protein
VRCKPTLDGKAQVHHVRPALGRLGARWLSAAALAVGLCVAVRGATAAVARSFEYLYVESNSGDSSGGHAAICFADRCYHFQQDEAQTIRLHRDTALEFDYRYRLLGNRTIHATRVELSPDIYERLRTAFQAKFQVEDRQYDELQSLTRDRQLLELIGTRPGGRGAAPGVAAVRVPGSGYFAADARGPAAGAGSAGPLPSFDWARDRVGSLAAAKSAGLLGLAARVRAVYGEQFIEHRAATLRAAIMQLVPGPAVNTLPTVSC